MPNAAPLNNGELPSIAMRHGAPPDFDSIHTSFSSSSVITALYPTSRTTSAINSGVHNTSISAISALLVLVPMSAPSHRGVPGMESATNRRR